MTKEELHILLKEHPVGNIQEQFFSKKYPTFYKDITSVSFPEDFKFSQKLYHYFNDDLTLSIGICPICGNRTSFISFVTGYQKYCSSKCAHKDEELLKRTQQTRLQIYGIGYKSIVQKSKDTKKFRYGDENYNNGEKHIQTCLDKYGVECYTQTEKYKDTIKKCNSERVKKIFETKKQHKTSNSSQIEELFEQFLTNKNIVFERQYTDNRYCDENGYEFHCDFYIPVYDLFIEIQGNWTHGKHPFDSSNPDDVEIVKNWKSKKSPYYDKAIDDWTNRDVKKRNIANQNDLNYLEFFTKDINEIITKFDNYVEEI